MIQDQSVYQVRQQLHQTEIILITSLAAEGNDGSFGNSAPNMYNVAIGGTQINL